MQNDSKHAESQLISITGEQLTGGTNNSSPSVLSKQGQEKQCALLENFFYSYNSGKFKTRWPFRRYSSSSLSGGNVDGLTVYDSEFLFSANNKLFYLDGKVPKYIGAIGTAPPCFSSYNGKLLIGSGTTPQSLTTARVLASITGTDVPTTVTQWLEERAYMWATGNTSYPDRVHRNQVNNETVWSGSDTAYFDMGYKDDDLAVIGMMNGPENNIIAWKSGTSKKATWFLNPSDTTPIARLVSTIYSAKTWRGACWANNKLWFMDDFSPLAIAGTDSVDQLIIDPASIEIGSRVSSKWKPTADSFCCVYPPDKQIWFFNPPSNEIWVLNFIDYAWYRFRPAGSLKFYSAYYHPTDQKMYLGGNDGYIYVYETSGEGAYQDEPGGVDTDYTQKIVTKIYTYYPKFHHEIKEPIINYLGLKDGSGYFRVYKNWGATEALNEALTISLSYPRAYSYASTIAYDARTIKAWASQMQSSIKDYNTECDNFQIWVEINSGAIEFHDVSFVLAKTSKLNY